MQMVNNPRYTPFMELQIPHSRFFSTFDKFYVIIACCEDIYGSYCIQKNNNNKNNKVK